MPKRFAIHWTRAAREQAAIRSAAAEWLGVRERGLTAAEEAEFAGWLAADRRHDEVFSEFEATWQAVGEALDGVAVPERSRRPAAPAWRLGLAAAAAVLVAAAVWTVRWERGWLFSPRCATAIGEERKFILPDGSVLHLNTDSAVAVEFTRAERRVRLERGEALFTVAKNPRRPFIVSADPVAVRAVGTIFSVRLRSRSVEVMVTEGKVRLDSAAQGRSALASIPSQSVPFLTAGERAVIPTSAGAPLASIRVLSVTAGEASRALAWERDRLEFGPTPLGEIVEEFNRYNSHRLVIADPAIADFQVGGAFQLRDEKGFVHLLETNFSISAERRSGETLLRGAREHSE